MVEVNGYHSHNDGDNAPLPFSGADVANLGGGDDLITGAIGFELRPMENMGFRVGYEGALSDGEDVFGYRWTFSLVYGF